MTAIYTSINQTKPLNEISRCPLGWRIWGSQATTSARKSHSVILMLNVLTFPRRTPVPVRRASRALVITVRVSGRMERIATCFLGFSFSCVLSDFIFCVWFWLVFFFFCWFFRYFEIIYFVFRILFLRGSGCKPVWFSTLYSDIHPEKVLMYQLLLLIKFVVKGSIISYLPLFPFLYKRIKRKFKN